MAPMGAPHSPLQASLKQGFNVLSGLLYLLALIMGVATILIWTIDEQENATERGFLMLGLCLAMVGAGYGLQRLVARPVPPPPPMDTSDSAVFRRTRLGPAWTDWIAPAVPVVLIGLPLWFASAHPPGETALIVGGVVLLLELLIAPALVAARRERVSLQLHPDGVLVRTRSGRERLVRRGELRSVALGVRHARNFVYGVLELHVGEKKPLLFREPMDQPLPQIAARVAAHMGAPLQDGTGG